MLVYYPPIKGACSHLCYQWRGPFVIKDKHGPLNYTLRSTITGKASAERFNINRLARYYPRHDAFLRQSV